MARILIAEDDFHIRFLIGKILQKAGHETYQVESGRQALQVLKGVPVDLIISDILMADIGGLQLLEETKKHYPTVPVVMLSVHTRSDWIRDTIRKGAACYLLKPFTHEQLITVVEDLVNTKHSKKERLEVAEFNTG